MIGLLKPLLDGVDLPDLPPTDSSVLDASAGLKPWSIGSRFVAKALDLTRFF